MSVLTTFIELLVIGWLSGEWCLIGVTIGISYLMKGGAFSFSNKAYGLNYETDPAPYTQIVLDSLAGRTFQKEDRDTTFLRLNNWHQKIQRQYKSVKLKLMIISTIKWFARKFVDLSCYAFNERDNKRSIYGPNYADNRLIRWNGWEQPFLESYFIYIKKGRLKIYTNIHTSTMHHPILPIR